MECTKPYCTNCNPPVITAEQFTALAQRLCDAGLPTTGRDAFLLWEWSNREEIRGELAIAEMRKLGYKPLAGYPLQRERVRLPCWNVASNSAVTRTASARY